jgi:hypothetical protein
MSFEEIVISGENFQRLCDVYLGMEYRLYNNPKIMRESSKHKTIASITTEWDNPRIVFCYGNGLTALIEKLKYFKNNCVLVSHNSDENITEKYLPILECEKIKIWYSQNVMINHNKLKLLPIGIANEMWPHGNVRILDAVMQRRGEKSNNIYFYFNIETNVGKRRECAQELIKKGLTFGNNEDHEAYLENISRSKYSISPSGKGIDCHRIWEGYYFGVIPIMKKTVFSQELQKHMPCVELENWSDLDEEKLARDYDELIHRLNSNMLDLRYFREQLNYHVENL